MSASKRYAELPGTTSHVLITVTTGNVYVETVDCACAVTSLVAPYSAVFEWLVGGETTLLA
jgi:hypothetical protein